MNLKKFKNISDNFIYWPELSQPQLSKINFSYTKIAEIIPIFQKQFQEKHLPIAPYIFQFYAYNNLINEMCKKHCDVVPKEYLELHLGYQHLLNEISEKIFTYIFIISLTEAGYCQDLSPIHTSLISKNKNHISSTDTLLNYQIDYRKYLQHFETDEGKSVIKLIINKLFSSQTQSIVNYEDLSKFIQEIGFNYCHSYSQTSAEISEEFLSGYNIMRFKNISTGALLIILEDIFYNGKFEANYGGSNWKKIINHVTQFTNGEINSEIFVDQSFSLEHNNGTLFSKKIIFDTSEKYNIVLEKESHEDRKAITTSKKFINFNQLLLNSQNHSSIFQILQMDIQGLLDNSKNQESVEYKSIEQFLIFQKFIKDKCSLFLDKFSTLIPNNIPVDFSEMLNFDVKINKKLLQYIDILSTNKANKFIFNIYDKKSILKRQISKKIVGNKAWGIAQLEGLGIPTPQALVLDIPTCISYTRFPSKFDKTFNKKYKSFGNMLGNLNNPKMVSVRSGGSISMPGMMDTILNVGIDDETYHNLCIKYTKPVIDECSIKFMEQFIKSIKKINYIISTNISLNNNLINFRNILIDNKIQFSGNYFPLSKEEQIKLCIKNVFSSWNSERAIIWRKENNIYDQSGTACTIQEMVLGNLNEKSMSGVIFSRDCILGTENMIGEYLTKTQGEDIVSGFRTPISIEQLKIDFPNIYNQLKTISKTLEDEYQCIQDIEFTVENGKLYILQHRKAIASPIANAQLLNSHYNLLSDLDMSVLKKSLDVQTTQVADLTGKCAQDGILHGIIINCEEDKNTFKNIYKENSFRGNFGWILSTAHSSPEHTPLLLKADAFITQQGGSTCHAAIIARSLKKPCIVGTGKNNLKSGDIITMNAYTGEIWNGIIPISYDSTQAFSISRNILKIHNFTEDEISFNKLNMTEIFAWNAQLKNSKVLEVYSPKENLSDIQKAAIMLVNNQRKLI